MTTPKPMTAREVIDAHWGDWRDADHILQALSDKGYGVFRLPAKKQKRERFKGQYQGPPSGYKKYRANYKKQWLRKQRDALADSYIRDLLRNRLGLKAAEIPQELIEAERAILAASRLIDAKVELDVAAEKFNAYAP